MNFSIYRYSKLQNTKQNIITKVINPDFRSGIYQERQEKKKHV